MSDAAPAVAEPLAPIAFTMLPGAGPACEGDDCLPAAALPLDPADS
ncbi:hypothetical protein [Amnibacterium kyonggiense]|uniref:Uncharacterized protein n=1 Tax=Amnibacterium kyonggiense TaxID=595671 RepID=A0A4R7FMA5_9MICO|nr:hypothetical protein [Amnibacterium kyonggiense]TDS77595.1 hypothetical protein CLV52_2553 [Amnibacterium kyonggiense]